MEYFVENNDLIDSVYFAFNKERRPIKSISESCNSHLNRLEAIPENGSKI